MILFLRSLAFNLAFYLNTTLWLIAAVPTFVLPYGAIVWVAKSWGLSNLFLLRVVAGIRADFRGLEKLPPGGFIAAAKHQSAWDTFALLWMFRDPTFILKRELQWIPLFGWFTIKGRMIPVDRSAGSQALTAMNARARGELARDRQIVIFPEGTRRRPGAEPKYKYGVAHLYQALEVPCLPLALNSGLFWPRRSLLRFPGTIVVEALPPIPPGLGRDAFFERLKTDTETATARLIEEGRRGRRG